MADKKVLHAALIVVTIIIIASMAWYYTYRFHTVLVPKMADGGTVAITCAAGRVVKIVSASYTNADGKAVDVAANLQKVLGALGGNSYTINGEALGQRAGGTLQFRYKCVAASTKSGFLPQAVTPCGSLGDDHYAVDMSSRNAAGTVVWDPYSTQSRVSLERYAESPEVATPANPITGVGNTAAVRTMGDRYRRNEALARQSEFELQPGQPGYMEEVGDDSTSLMARVSRRSPTSGGSPASCSLANTDIDSDFYTDGYYDAMVLKDTFTSTRMPRQNTLTASRTGLGSVRQDPRFEPGPEWRVPGGDASWSHGGHAGGPTSGGFAPAVFAPTASWGTNYVAGFGDPNNLHSTRRTAEVITEEPLTWTH